MKQAIKKKTIVKAYQLGTGSEMEKSLIAKGVIKPLDNGRYEIFSQEAINGRGEIAQAGDYFKVDDALGREFAYPNDREFFEKKHRHIHGDIYEQVASPVWIWCLEDGPCEIIQFLLDEGMLVIHKDDPDKYFSAELWGAELSAAQNAVIVFYHIERNTVGNIIDVNFNLVQHDYFEEHYDILP